MREIYSNGKSLVFVSSRKVTYLACFYLGDSIEGFNKAYGDYF